MSVFHLMYLSTMQEDRVYETVGVDGAVDEGKVNMSSS